MFDDESMIIVHVGFQGNGWTFALSPYTKHRIGEKRGVPCVFFGNESREDNDPRRYAHLDEGFSTEKKWGRWWIVASMLTGIPEEDLGTCMFRRMPEDTLLETLER